MLSDEWPEHAAPSIAGDAAVIVNGTDDLAAGLQLYRTASAAGTTVIDAYMSPLPSVMWPGPTIRTPEERLGFPTLGTDWRTLPEKDQARRHALRGRACHAPFVARAIMSISPWPARWRPGKRSRMSFAPMVITTGMLMAYEAIALILGRRPAPIVAAGSSTPTTGGRTALAGPGCSIAQALRGAGSCQDGLGP